MLISTVEEFRRFERWVEERDTIAVDTETDGLSAYNGNKIVGVSVGVGEEAFYLPYRHGIGPNLPESLVEPLINLLNSRRLIFHNGKFDLHMLGREGLDIDSVEYEETMLAAHLVNSQEPTLALKKLADKYEVGVGSKDEEELFDAVNSHMGKKQRKNEWKGHMWRLPSAVVEPYASTDARLTWGLWELYKPALEQLGFFESTVADDPEGLYRADVEYNKILTKMERRGLLIDRDLLEQYDVIAQQEMERVHRWLISQPGIPKDFNPGSHVQTKQALGVASSAAEFLEALGTPLSEAVIEWRAYRTAHSNYYAKYRSTMNRENVLRADFQQAGTKTGRLSCWNPNLQAISRYTERQPIKDLFIARPGWTLMEFDLSQAELRVTAYYANVAGMMEIFRQGLDLHSATAENLGIPRDTAKRINLSAIYGIGVSTFARKYKMSEETARHWLEVYHTGYPEIKRFYKGIMRKAEKDHMITLPTGRIKRYLIPETNAYDPRGFNMGEQKAASNFIQGTVAEIMRIAMTRIDRNIDPERARMLLTVHDSILFEVRKDGKEMEVAREIYEYMTSFGDLPLDSDAKIGDRWGKMRKADLNGEN